VDIKAEKDCAKCRREMDERLYKVIEQAYDKKRRSKKRKG
jgi:hypothetical protein